MKKVLLVVILLITAVIIKGQQVTGKIDKYLYIGKNFFNEIYASSESLADNTIWFGVFPRNDKRIKRFRVHFRVPENVKIYNKVYLNGNKTVAGYNPVFAVKKINDTEIYFDFKDIISKHRNRYFWFHVVPYLDGKGKIIANFDWEYSNGEKGRGQLFSGEIKSKKPTLAGVETVVNGSNLVLKFPLHYKFDYKTYTPSDAQYLLQIKNDETQQVIILHTNKLKFLPNKNGEEQKYTIVTGKIEYEDTKWIVNNMRFSCPGEILSESSTSKIIVDKGFNNNGFMVNFLGDGMTRFAILGRAISSEFSKYPSILHIKTEVISVKFKNFFLNPLELNYSTRFDGIDYFDIRTRVGFFYKSIIFSGAYGIGTEINWQNKSLPTNLMNVELCFAYKIIGDLSVNISGVLSSLASGKDAYLNGLYLGLGYIFPRIY